MRAPRLQEMSDEATKIQAEDLIKWVDRRVEKSLRAGSGDTTLAQVLWFVCVQEARLLLEDTTRSNARGIRDGIGPYKTIEHLQGWLDTLEGVQTEEELHEDLLEFWKEGA